MARVEYDPETLTFELYFDTGLSGCDVESWRFDTERWLFEVWTCIHGEQTAIMVEPETGVDDLREAADKAGLQAQLLLAAPKPELLDEYFIDVRYVIDSRGELVAVELLPCMGSPECRWVRIEGSTKTEKLFLDTLEELVPCKH